MLNGYMNEQIEAKKAKALFAIAAAIEKLADAIRERPIVIQHDAEIAKKGWCNDCH